MPAVTIALPTATELVHAVLVMLSFEFYLPEGGEEENAIISVL